MLGGLHIAVGDANVSNHGGNGVPFKRLAVVTLFLSLLANLIELLWRLTASAMVGQDDEPTHSL